jgi:hypothetical protein
MFLKNNLLLRQECFEREASQNAALCAVEKFIAKEAKKTRQKLFLILHRTDDKEENELRVVCTVLPDKDQ